MNKAFIVKRIIGLAMALLMMASVNVSVAETLPTGRWVLVDVIDGENIKSWDAKNNSSESFRFDHTYARGSYSVTTTFLGDTDNYYNPPKINGEAFGFQATMSTPPATFNAGDTIDISVSVSLTLDTLSFFGGGGGAQVYWGGSSTTNPSVRGYYELKGSTVPAERFKTVNETFRFVAPTGSAGQKRSLEYHADAMNTEYIYEWSSTKQPVNPATSNLVVAPAPTPAPTPVPTPIQTPVKTERVDSGIKFSDLYGEVSIRRGDDEDDSFEFAELDMVIYVGDVIRVKEESGMILSMPDMSTFRMNTEGRLIINTSNEKENKLKLLAGNIYANVKKMLQTGTMEVEMSQGVAGIKGTTFVLEETGTTSTVKVLEGSVELRSKATGKTVLVTAGKSGTVANGGDPVVKAISIHTEATAWDKTLIELQLNNPMMKVNGDSQEIDPGRGTAPLVIDNRTLIPIRSVIEALGGTVDYNASEKKITIKLQDKTLHMWLNSKTITLNGQTLQMDVAPVVVNDRTMVPIRFVIENLNYDVDWHQADKKVIIQ